VDELKSQLDVQVSDFEAKRAFIAKQLEDAQFELSAKDDELKVLNQKRVEVSEAFEEATRVWCEKGEAHEQAVAKMKTAHEQDVKELTAISDKTTAERDAIAAELSELQKQAEEVQSDHTAELKRVQSEANETRAAIEKTLSEKEESHSAALQALKNEHAQAVKLLQDTHTSEKDSAVSDAASATQDMEAKHQSQLDERTQLHESAVQDLKASHEAMQRLPLTTTPKLLKPLGTLLLPRWNMYEHKLPQLQRLLVRNINVVWMSLRRRIALNWRNWRLATLLL
jgi:hypothetical protein